MTSQTISEALQELCQVFNAPECTYSWKQETLKTLQYHQSRLRMYEQQDTKEWDKTLSMDMITLYAEYDEFLDPTKLSGLEVALPVWRIVRTVCHDTVGSTIKEWLDTSFVAYANGMEVTKLSLIALLGVVCGTHCHPPPHLLYGLGKHTIDLLP